MGAYVWQRAWQGAISLFGLAIVVFALSRSTGSPIALLLPVDATPEQYQHLTNQLGLNHPIVVQFWYFLKQLAHGSLGDSIKYREPVTTLLGAPLLNSARLIVPSFLLAFVVGIPLGVSAAITKHSSTKKAFNVFTAICTAAPAFWIGLLLMYVFSVRLHLLPSGFIGGISHYVLPVGTLSLFLLAGIARLVCASLLEAMSSDYIKLARLSGLSERRIVWKHALRNSLISTTSFIGVYMASLITGNIVIERVFSWPGAGNLLYSSIVGRDYPVVQGIILFSATLVIAFNLLVDICQAYLDPRIKLGSRSA